MSKGNTLEIGREAQEARLRMYDSGCLIVRIDGFGLSVAIATPFVQPGSAAGLASGAATASGEGAVLAKAAGSTEGEATVTAVGASKSSSEGVGSTDGSATATGVGSAMAKAAGQSQGGAVVSGVAVATTAGSSGQSAGSSDATAVGRALAKADGQSQGGAVVSGVAVATTAGSSGQAAGSSDATAVGRALAKAVGQSQGTSSAAAGARASVVAVGQALGTSNATGDARASARADGTSGGVASASAVGAGSSPLTGTIAITTPLKTNQVWQRDRATLTLAGTYDLSADPSGMEWRVGSGDWEQLSSETIGSDAWSGTLDIPSDYLAQGQLQVRPVGAPSITDTHDDVTVSDVFAILGDSLGHGGADAADIYTKTNFDWVEHSGGVYAIRTSQTTIWPELAEQLDQVSIPPAFVRHTIQGSAFHPGAGASWDPSPSGPETSEHYDAAVVQLNGAATGGFKGLIWEHGANDVQDSTTTYDQDIKDLIDALQADVTSFTGVQMMISLIGEVGTETTDLETVRVAQLSAIATDADILRGPSWLDLDFGDNVHFGRAPATVAQQQVGGGRWWRAIENHFYSGTDPVTGPVISSVTVTDADEITVTFDRDVQNHADTTGWKVEDKTGVASISAAAQGANATEVVLTMGSALRTNSGEVEDVLVSFGEANEAVGATLSDTATISYPPEHTIDADAGEAYPYNTATPALDGTPTEGVAVTCDGGTWESTSAITYTYQWREAAGGAAISGATSASYTPVAGDSAYLNTMVCDVTATNGKGATSVESLTGVSGQFDLPASTVLAYSMARAFDGYTGNLIRVRRSSDNAEADIGVDASGNLDEAALLAHTGTGGSDQGYVRTVYEQSGHVDAVDLGQVVPAEQPTIVENGVVVKLSGKPAVAQSAGDSLDLASWTTRPSNVDVFYVASYETGGNRLFLSGSSSHFFGVMEASTSTVISAKSGSPSYYHNTALIGTEGAGLTRQDLWDAYIDDGASLCRASNLSSTDNGWRYSQTKYSGAIGGPNEFSELLFLAAPTAQETSDTDTDMASFYNIAI